MRLQLRLTYRIIFYLHATSTMSRPQGGYQTLLFRSLLLSGYLVLFAFQFNSRYFVISNNVVYGKVAGSGTFGTIGLPTGEKSNGKATLLSKDASIRNINGQGVVLRYTPQNPSHLSVDKRFSFNQAIRVPEIRGPDPLFFADVASPVLYYSPHYSSYGLPANTLRGPPCVHPL